MSTRGGIPVRRCWRSIVEGLVLVLFAMPGGCAGHGRLAPVATTVAPVPRDTTVRDVTGRLHVAQTWRPMFGDTLIGLVPGTGDSTRRYLGRLRDGYAADTINVMLFGDNRPGWRSARLQTEYAAVHKMFVSPRDFFNGLVAIPVGLAKGVWPDLALIRDIPDKVTNMPRWGREKQVMSAMLAKIDSLHKQGQIVSAVVNSGDLVDDGRTPAHWKRFLSLNQPLINRVSYFAVAGNHERTDTEDGVANWRAATGLPVGTDRLYYCFDSADGWLRFIAIDTNPIVDPGTHWSRDVQVKYSDEEFKWLVDRVKEHHGPVIVMMHHPPFSAGYHRHEWEHDPVLRDRRARMVRALHENGSSVIVSGHEHAYQRALLTWPDGVLVSVVTGGGGAPLHDLPPPPEAAALYAQYQVAGAVVKPQNVYTNSVFNFVLLRLWFGGGALFAYAVDAQGRPTQIDEVKVDLKRYGIPKIDQHKIPIPPSKGPQEPSMHESAKNQAVGKGKSDSTAAGQRILTKPAPGKKRVTVRKPTSTRRGAG
jgi:hypothetical protein